MPLSLIQSSTCITSQVAAYVHIKNPKQENHLHLHNEQWKDHLEHKNTEICRVAALDRTKLHRFIEVASDFMLWAVCVVPFTQYVI